jgi:hypothetical protein
MRNYIKLTWNNRKILLHWVIIFVGLLWSNIVWRSTVMWNIIVCPNHQYFILMSSTLLRTLKRISLLSNTHSHPSIPSYPCTSSTHTPPVHTHHTHTTNHTSQVREFPLWYQGSHFLPSVRTTALRVQAGSCKTDSWPVSTHVQITDAFLCDLALSSCPALPVW